MDRSNIDECALMLITFISFFSLDHVYTQEISLCTVHESRRTVQRTAPPPGCGNARSAPPAPDAASTHLWVQHGRQPIRSAANHFQHRLRDTTRVRHDDRVQTTIGALAPCGAQSRRLVIDRSTASPCACQTKERHENRHRSHIRILDAPIASSHMASHTRAHVRRALGP